MQTNSLKRIYPNTKRMIVARGGKRGKTAGRGGKGQSARAGNKRRPEWRDIIKKLPKLRGRGVNQNKPVSERPVIVNLGVLAGAFSAKDAITPTILVEKGIISTWSGRTPMVKILGDGDITVALKVSGCTVSESAKAKIEKAGGSVEAMASTVVPKQKGPSIQSDLVANAPAKPVKAAKPAKAAKPKKADAASGAPAEKKVAKPKKTE